jgi:hypothetical protein
LMPRYALDDPSMHALIGYLRQLWRGPVRGASDTALDFATIITPDADPADRSAMLDVLSTCFGAGGSANQGEAAMQSSRNLQSQGARTWRLHVWQLTGTSVQWEQELRQHLAAEPVFAVVSGLGHKNWAPVHAFCQSESLPCLLPNVDLPVVAEDDFYPVYFSKGVLLEAELIANRLQNTLSAPAPRVLQIYRADDIGAAAAAALRKAVDSPALKFRQQVLEARAPASALARALATAQPSDAVVLWLRPGDLKALPARPPSAAGIYLSGLMGGLDAAPLPDAWRGVARMAYPFEMPQRRGINMDYAQGWFKFHRIRMTQERIQTNTFLACGIMTEAVGRMLDNLIPDYLLELVELQLGHRVVNGYYSRLGLGAGQRFASKGGYLVRFDGPAAAPKLVADGDWIVP